LAMTTFTSFPIHRLML